MSDDRRSLWTRFPNEPDRPSISNSDQGVPDGGSSDGDPRARLRSQRLRRAFFLDNLKRNLDIVVYCQLSILYYMDCSLFRFFLRAVPHWVLFTPKPPIFPIPPSNRPYVSSIIATSGFCALVHLFMSRPEAGEATRGYLYGSLLTNFVGELGPISRWRMLLVDIFIALLQVIMIGITLERRNLRTAIDTRVSGVSGAQGAGLVSSIIPSSQDLDAEEQGIRRSQDNLGNDIELQALGKDGERGEPPDTGSKRNEHALDPFYSGQLVIADLYLAEAVRTAWERTYGT